MNKYKVGDKVVISKDFNAYSYNVDYKMLKYQGIITTITQINPGYKVECDEGTWWWEEEYLKPAEELPITTVFEEINKAKNSSKNLIQSIGNIEKAISQLTLSKGFNWEDFKNNKIAIECENLNQIKLFLKECDKNNIKFKLSEYDELFDWYNKIAYLYEDNKVVFAIGDNHIGGLKHCNNEYFLKEDYNIIKYNDIFKTPISIKDFSTLELVEELKRRNKDKIL